MASFRMVDNSIWIALILYIGIYTGFYIGGI